MVKQDRSVAMYILMSALTCGIYNLYFIYKMAEDMNTVCYGDNDDTTSGATLILLSLFTCGIYQYIWYYQLAQRQQENGERYGVKITESASSVILWMLAGMFIVVGPFIAIHIVSRNMNRLAAAYNSSAFGGARNGQQNYMFGGAQNNANQGYGNPNAYANGQAFQREVFLTCKKGEFNGSVFPLRANDRISIGRDLSCNIKFASNTPKISRRHCTVEFDGNNIWLTDNNSSYGTYLMDGTKLAPMNRVPLSAGTGFYLGSQDVIFYV